MNLRKFFYPFLSPSKEMAEVKSFSVGFTPMNPSAYLTQRDGPRTDTAALQRTARLNELVYACLQIKATAMQDPRLIVEKRQSLRDGSGKRKYVEVEDHPLRLLLARPNPDMSEADLMAAAMVSWETTNPRMFFAEKVYRRGELIEIWPLDPSRMEERKDSRSGELLGYDFVMPDGRRISYGLDDLIIRKAPAWYKPSPSAVVAGSAESDQAQTEYVRSFFLNGGTPSMFIKDTQRALNTSQRDQIRQAWTATYSNRSGGQHSIGVLDQYQEVVKYGASLDELDSETLRMVAESRICMAFGVPPLIVYSYVGLMRATYSNLKEAWASFWDATMSPALKEWRDFFGRTLLPEYEDISDVLSERYRLNYDLSQVAALQDDVDARDKRAVLAYRAGLITLNEGRTRIGEKPDPTPAGDAYYTKPAVPQEPVKEGDDATPDDKPA